jgi:hypothetical protein
LALTTAVDIAKPICQAQRAATGVVAHMTTETQVLFLICANLRNLRIGCVTSVILVACLYKVNFFVSNLLTLPRSLRASTTLRTDNDDIVAVDVDFVAVGVVNGNRAIFKISLFLT